MWRNCPAAQVGPLTTELLPGDGPVAVLARYGECRLVRAPDGTVGWIAEPLGPNCGPPRPSRPRHPPRQIREHLEPLLRAPYLQGGTTVRGVDCSGLSQRLYRDVFDIVIPRHSTDQLAYSRSPKRSLGRTGDLIFLTPPGGACHVGILIPDHRHPMVAHASSQRSRVVCEPLEEFTRRSAKVDYATLEDMLGAHRTNGRS